MQGINRRTIIRYGGFGEIIERVHKAVFRQTVQVALKNGLVGIVLYAAGSKQRAWHGKELLGRVDRSIEAMGEEVEERQEQQSGEYRLPEELQRQDLKRLLPMDPQARMMQCGSRPGVGLQCASGRGPAKRDGGGRSGGNEPRE